MMIKAKMKILLQLVVWIFIAEQADCHGIGFGIKKEIFFLNLEDGYFGCQVNESTDFLQLYELSRLCDGRDDCYMGSDELARELKCTRDCNKQGPENRCLNGACLDSQCHCNDGFGGCSCEVPDENECKSRPCDVFAHCTNTLGSFHCTCFPGYAGDGFHCQDINECEDPLIAARCVPNSECCNLPAHFLCKCLPGFQGDGEEECIDIDECLQPGACGPNALCQNIPGNYTCTCQPGFEGNPLTGCTDIDECTTYQGACGLNAICSNTDGGYICACPLGSTGDPFHGACIDIDECLNNPCGLGAICTNTPESYTCICPPGFVGDPYHTCSVIGCVDENDCPSHQSCYDHTCQDPCSISNPCAPNEECQVHEHHPACVKVCQCQKDLDCQVNSICDGCRCIPQGEDRVVMKGCEHCPPGLACDQLTGACIKAPIGRPKKPQPCEKDTECLESEACYNGMCEDLCGLANLCAPTAKCHVVKHRPVCTCPPGHQGNPAVKCFLPKPLTCISNEDCGITEACIGHTCQHPCDVHNPCAQNAVCINTNHGCDCVCSEGYNGNGYVGCIPGFAHKSVCQYNEDCPDDRLCDRLNRVCINPCSEDSCGENAQCIPVNHGTDCKCLPGYVGNAYLLCSQVSGCHSDLECPTNEACIQGRCGNPCNCGPNAICDVISHKPICKCLPGYGGNAKLGCTGPLNPCDPNPCGINAHCEVDAGGPICFCPKGMTGNPFKNCIPEGNECTPNPCGPNSGCRVVHGSPVCFCLPEYEGNPPRQPCTLPRHPCNPSPCGPNTQCSVLDNGFAKCTCLPGYIESPNTIRGCVERTNPCYPNPCGHGALCDRDRNPPCYCPDPLVGNPYRTCAEPMKSLCQPGPCGLNADCYISGNTEQCYCRPGTTGDPYTICNQPPRTACWPNPCGPLAVCTVTPNGHPMCLCPDGIAGDPTTGCGGPQCVTDDDCSNTQACVGHRCIDPCPGSCGFGANCRVEKHHPICTCNHGLIGNPLCRCFLILGLEGASRNPCEPSPCGLNTNCRVANGRPVCSCLPHYLGDPKTGCRPECILNSDCPSDSACINQRCVQPCSSANVCGLGAICTCSDHTPFCSCPPGYLGDPYIQCIPSPIVVGHNTTLPCAPSPCGLDAVCSVYGQAAMCNPCGKPESAWDPRCRPECLADSDCPYDKACLNYRCISPCPGSCGVNAQCTCVQHKPVCSCPSNHIGNPFEHCAPRPPDSADRVNTCDRIRCGSNAKCHFESGVNVCRCLPNFYGDPYLGCHPECVINSDCGYNKACINYKCVDPCSGACGVNALCTCVNHIPVCHCPDQHTGDPFVTCYPINPALPPSLGHPGNPCDPSPCGPNSRCIVSHQGFAVCSCLPGYRGVPPVCQPECLVSSECLPDRACINQKCTDPCPGLCGIGARCLVMNHNPVCSCPPGQVGDPFIRCHPPAIEEPKIPSRNPCDPTPCGPNSICIVREGRPVCSCSANYIGSPPYCRPECLMSQECPHDQACIQEKCKDPCSHNCGTNAQCHVVNHTPFCSCLPGYQGDAFVGCYQIPATVVPEIPKDPCDLWPCAENAQCSNINGVARCTCIPPYVGDPYSSGCKPECLINADCAPTLACLSSHCRDPCPGVCGNNAQCSVVNHIAVCTCFEGYIGDPFQSCRPKPIEPVKPINPCDPNPCGANSVCRVQSGTAACSCIQGYIGVPPSCRPECIASSECNQNKACINQKCIDPCPGTCGLHAICHVINHNPICSCPPKTVGDPFIRCIQEVPKVPVEVENPCMPSPCGGNSQCRVVDHRPVCSCLPGMLGAPPNCRPECLIHADCPNRLACIGSKCKDPCVGSCGFNALCNVVNHQPICSCQQGYHGDPFSGCSLATERTPEKIDPCFPSPCGANAECHNRNGVGACSCLAGFQGDPYTGCRRECESNVDCATALACIGFKCVNPCPGTCGTGAECTVANHIPICSCPAGFTGDPFFSCHQAPPSPPPKPQDPCFPSPCGPNSQCRTVNQQAVCSCMANYIGNPPTCRPECVVNSECTLDKACINQKCADPCPNTCGLHAQCTTKNHNPICACPQGYTGDPFSQCHLIPATPAPPPTREPLSCSPSPCGPNSQCQIVRDQIACSCLPNYLGNPPNCRPECVISSECSSELACINQKCKDPCTGSCGANANCRVVNHVPVCSCNDGYTGDPFTFCSPVPLTTPQPPAPKDPCNPSPCGPNAVCRDGLCECMQDYSGNPYEACRPECVLHTECSRDKACFRNKCRDPCPGTCGQNAQCDVVNHIPTCSCPQAYTGDPFTLCRPLLAEPVSPADPCNPSPCGPNSQCRAPNNVAVCSCLPGFMGSPPACRPECLQSAECSQTQACVNKKCTDPCLGSCGLNARCQVINHSPICSCPPGQTGDPFRSCYDIPVLPPPKEPVEVENPCQPSPCGPNSQCLPSQSGQPSCSCMTGYIGSPPNCRPECVINPDCPSNQACINNKCVDPCPGTCGINAQCSIISHAVACTCLSGFTGNAFVQCVEQKQEVKNPCEPSPCGPNAECTQRNGAGSCSCIQDYTGNPYEGCRPECVLSSDCPTNKACVRNKCEDPCPGVCGQNAQCSVINHIPTCTCVEGHVGNPFVVCATPPPSVVTQATVTDPCSPSPCGPNSQCRNVNNQAVCSCAPDFQGTPPNCRPECVVNSECPTNRACYKNKCTDPCPGTCGLNARCQVINHNPICSCPTGQTGDPFTRCYLIPATTVQERPSQPVNPCTPSPCGSNSVCQVTAGNQASCSCLPSYVGSPPNCRPECVVNTDCPLTQACITEKCRDPCIGSCGLNADCRVQNHIPTCSCMPGFTGDPFTQCSPIPPAPTVPTVKDPCNPSPCGANANCNNGQCTCLPDYFGDPYIQCRPECTMNSDCTRNKACSNQHCVDPCPGTCGQGATCDVINHIPTCSCPPQTTGDPFTSCRPRPTEPPRDPCNPSPCGPNSICRVSDGHAVCTCQSGMIGTPPQCRPECVVSAECPLTQACLNSKCRDPCVGTCGLGAKCNVVNHNPICSCPPGQTGDPFRQCYPTPVTPKPVEPVDPCRPSPCGPNSDCKVLNGSPACSCLSNYIGAPPNCRPECTINPECAPTKACVNQRCIDPCPGSCGSNARCSVINHTPICSCNAGFTGDPFTACSPLQEEPPRETKPINPCLPSPCGPNAVCRIEGTYAVCECSPEYQGNPYEGCRPECVVSSDCAMSRACIRNKCRDPCPGTCGLAAICTVSNHIPICSCPEGYEGNAFTICTPVPKPTPEVQDPCIPSPCGPNTQCNKVNDNAVCSCLPGFQGVASSTTGCRPECVISPDCPRNRACVNNKCLDPCPGVCGYLAICHVVNHSPICSCPPQYNGDPFVECQQIPVVPDDPCNPSPCGQNGQCHVVNGVATCIYPECVINQDCPRDKTCYTQKCRDPCLGACGLNAICQTVNHKAVCSCPRGYIGEPRIQCQIQPQVLPKPECSSDQECANNKACINQICSDPCQLATTSVCAYNAECRVQMHRPLCVCREGLTGNAQNQCFDIGCRSDSECPPSESCVNRECVDPCRYTQCGTGATCEVVGGKARCRCPPGYFGDSQVRCERPQCTSDSECPSQLACRNLRCQNPCDCAKEALCTVTAHVPTCRCPPGYIGNPHQSCTIAPIVGSQKCKMDADCPSKMACFSGDCRNPCLETNPCGDNAECLVVDTLPLRTMSCQCLAGFIGDADVKCTKAPQEGPGCSTDLDCVSSEICLNRKCVNPCEISNPCAKNAICQPINHKAVCKCPDLLVGDPFVNCYKVPVTSPECKSDSDCPSPRACINQRCQDPCIVNNPCGTSAECTTIQHRPTCTCPQGWAGNPQIHCYRPECKEDADCVYDKACIGGNCISPCGKISCGRGAECIASAHAGRCVCPAGTQGDPHVSCISVACHYNEDCADHEACDRLNRVCRPVCEKDTCGRGAECSARRHQPQCHCLPGTQGDPYIECTDYRTPLPSPECQTDADCPSKMACIKKKCQNPCSLPAVCSPDQECSVLDSLPLRTVMCVCPSDTIASTDGHCMPIVAGEVECRVDSDCRDTDRCVRGSCKEACRIDPCGLNAQCASKIHQSICTCPSGYVGNPHIECTFEQIYPVPQPIPECTQDDECSDDKWCRNRVCVNPCAASTSCAPGAFCHAQNHQPICKCPAGFSGNPLSQCIPPSEATVSCSSNSECSPKESCLNRICVSPCNCGPNAECKVQDHYPICYCQPGYSGNPQIGCVKVGCEADNQCNNDQMCYNGECINPCIVGDVCGANSECYGSDHRAKCRCLPGYTGSPMVRCDRVECSVDADCPTDRTCLHHRCLNPCVDVPNSPCAQNGICFVKNHVAACRCPEYAPLGNPLAYCHRPPPPTPAAPECERDVDCPTKQACIRNSCKNPCAELSPCSSTAMCNTFDTTPIRTMVCTCPEGWVPDNEGECKAVIVPTPPGCTADSECSANETCINRMCRNPCDCGPNAQCFVSDHRPICSCIPGYDGNPNIGCLAVGCRSDSECASGKACINGNCINPCVINDPCGPNAECYAVGTRAECRCLSGYRGNPYDRCLVVGCRSNSDCPNDRACINAQCINPCVYEHPCAPLAECQIQNHLSLCRCPPDYEGNPYVSCRPRIEPECKQDGDCPPLLACFSGKCKNPCTVLEPCQRPAKCEVVPSLPVRTMICECPPGYISSGSGTCQATPPITAIGECVVDNDCTDDKSCINAICKDPCNCGPNAECRVKDHKPICSCLRGFDGNPDLECVKAGCRSDSDCSGQHACLNRECVPVCSPDGSTCGTAALCYGSGHHAVCSCPPGLTGDPQVGCRQIECETNSDCPSDKACLNTKCVSPCTTSDRCIEPAECTVYNHIADCSCPPGYVGTLEGGCKTVETKCEDDSDCPSQTACINSECVNPCNATVPCGINTMCQVFDTYPVRTMICECLPGYHGNAAVQCDKVTECPPDKGFSRDADGNCVCPPGTGLNTNDECERCLPEKGMKIDDRGRCVCDLDKGFVIDERGRCVCPVLHGYTVDVNGNCSPGLPECTKDDDCEDHRYCNPETKMCDDPCSRSLCGINALCNATRHVAVCQCISGYIGDAYVMCNTTSKMRTDFPRPDMVVSCLSDGVQVEIHIEEKGFNGVLYVKGHSKDEKCRRVVSLPNDSQPRTEIFKVNFGTCGLIHVNGQASFVLVIQKHPMLVTFKTQAYHIKCVYTTGEQNVTLGFNVSMLTTAGTIANTGPPPTCLMRIVTQTGQEINSAEIGDNLKLQVDVQPASIYGGFARSCVAKTMEDTVENEYIVTDENGCATDPSIFGEWDYNPETQSLLANFNAFKFPSSDNIRFQCNIRVCFGKCQPVNCGGYNAFGRRRREIDDRNNTVVEIAESVNEGQLREEITIQSNAILTFERRGEERFVDPTEAPSVQQIEDICVSMIGFIIAIVITALLSLVAVAVAVSCWLIAYRRRPKTGGPLPHPPEFPNPLFTTPEPLAEPSPDYLS